MRSQEIPAEVVNLLVFMEDFIMYSELPRKVSFTLLGFLLQMDFHPCCITAKQTPYCTTNSLQSLINCVCAEFPKGRFENMIYDMRLKQGGLIKAGGT